MHKEEAINMKNKHSFERDMMSVHNPDQAIRLLKKGMPIDFRDKDGNTLLMMIIQKRGDDSYSYYKYAESVALLISSGANVNISNLKGETALTLAFDYSRILYKITSNNKKRLTVGLLKNIFYPWALDKLDNKIIKRIKRFHLHQIGKIILMLLEAGAEFSEEQGRFFYQQLLQLNLNDYYVYKILCAIKKRFSYPQLSEFLHNLDDIFEAVERPRYLALEETRVFPKEIAKLISEYDDEDVTHKNYFGNNYLMQENVNIFFSSSKKRKTREEIVENLTELQSSSKLKRFSCCCFVF